MIVEIRWLIGSVKVFVCMSRLELRLFVELLCEGGRNDGGGRGR